MPLRSMAFLAAFSLLSLTCLASEPLAAPQERAVPVPFEVPQSVEQALALDDFEAALEGREKEELERWLREWMALVEGQEAALQVARVAAEGSELHDSATGLVTDRDALLALAEALITATAAAGGEVERARERVAAIRQAGANELEGLSTVPADQSSAADLPLEVLRSELRPLTKAQVEEQLAQWQQLLQRKCLEVRNIEVAALESERVELVEKFNEGAVELRGERGRLIERVRAVIDSLEEKNGDVEDARAYLKSVVAAPPIQGWRAAWTTAEAWAFSPDGGIDLSVRLGKAFGLIAVFWGLSRLAAGVVARAMRSFRKTSELLREFVIGSARKSVFFLGALIAASQLGINLGPLLAVIGAAGLVLGFALQGTLSNFASGLLIMVYRPFDVGDSIEASGIKGNVEGMTLVTTLVKTFDNRTIYIPNNKIWGDVITNITANDTRRIDLTIGISYDDDVDRAKEVLMATVKRHEKVLADPEPNVQVDALADSSVNFIVRPWARTEDYWAVYWGLTRSIKKDLDAAGITIPYPQRDVHIHHHDGK